MIGYAIGTESLTRRLSPRAGGAGDGRGCLHGGQFVRKLQFGDRLGALETTLAELAQVLAPGALDVAKARVEGKLEAGARAVAAQARGQHVAGVRAALTLEQVEDGAAEDDRVARRRRKCRCPALTKPGTDGGPEQRHLARVVLGGP